VLGEFDLDEGDYDFQRRRRMLEELFGDYESRVEPLGSRSVVTATTSDELHAAHDEYYVPNNALLVFSGDVTAKDARAFSEKHFGDWPRAPDPFAQTPTPRPAALERSHYVVLPAPIADTRISIGWMCPGTRDDLAGTLAGRVLAAVTTESDHSFRSLVTPGLATSASFGFTANQYASYVTVTIVTAQGGEDDVLRTAKSVLDVIGLPSDVSGTQLGIAKDQLWTSYFFGAEDPSSLPHTIAAQWSLANVDQYQSLMHDVYAVEQADLDRFAGGCVRGQPHAVILQSSPENLSQMGIDESFLGSRL
jgi:zinc protease